MSGHGPPDRDRPSDGQPTHQERRPYTAYEAGDQGLVARLKAKVERARERSVALDHVLSALEHYKRVDGNLLAGGATYFGFLSFFPILAIGLFVIGYVSEVVPDAQEALETALTQVFPGILSDSANPGEGQISLQQIADAKAVTGVIGLVGVLYSGLGWLSGLRKGLISAFEVPSSEKPNFVVGKFFDLITLTTVGLVLIVSVGLAGAVRGLADQILDFLALPEGVGDVVIFAISIVLGVGASTLLFFALYRLLPKPDLPRIALLKGALLGAVGFEVLKQLAVTVLGASGGSAFAPLAVAITLVVWINYFHRLTMYGAAWASTDPATIAQLQEEARYALMRPAAAARDAASAPEPRHPEPSGGVRGLVGGAAVVGVVLVTLRELIRRSADM